MADKSDMAELLGHAFDTVYTFFDTAELYDISDNPYANEDLFGKVLRNLHLF
ncbi:MAG: hypothetical protein J6A20_00320 [Muribaculaceae bacterium]|nr:hypothetical protein [Muribaculaceae bacterium]